MAGWYHQCNELELGQTLGDDEGQGGPACFSPWGHKESDVTGRQNNNSHSSDMSQKGAHACLVCFSETDESLSVLLTLFIRMIDLMLSVLTTKKASNNAMKGCEEAFGGDKYISYLDCGDGTW